MQDEEQFTTALYLVHERARASGTHTEYPHSMYTTTAPGAQSYLVHVAVPLDIVQGDHRGTPQHVSSAYERYDRPCH